MGAEVAGYVRVPWGSADDCWQSPRPPAGALCMGIHYARGWVWLKWGRNTWEKLCFIRHSDEHSMQILAIGSWTRSLQFTRKWPFQYI